MSILLPGMPQLSDPLDRGLVGEWRFDRDHGLFVPDYTRYGHAAAIENTVRREATQYGPALRLQDDISNWTWVKIDAADHLEPTAELTLEALFIPDRIDAGGKIFSHQRDDDGWLLYQVNDDWRFYVGDGNTTYLAGYGAYIVAQELAHVVAVFKGGEFQRVYHNGEQVAEQNTTAASISYSFASATDIYLGRDSDFVAGAEVPAGLLLMARIYNRALSATEVRRRYEIVRARAGGTAYLLPIQYLEVATAGGDVTITPTSVSVVATKVDPAVVLGSLTIAPAADSVVVTGIDPEVALGSVAITPTATSAVASVVDPEVALGSLTVTPTAVSGVATTVDPMTVLGSVAVSPDSISAVTAGVDPAVDLGSVVVTPAVVSGVVTTVDPTVTTGDLIVVPTESSVVTGAADPVVVLGSVSVSPSSISAIASGMDPAVVLGSIVVTVAPSALVAGGVAPTVVLGGISISPTPTVAIVSGVDPAVVLGSVGIAPEAISAIAVSVNPDVYMSSMSYTPTAVFLVVRSHGPTVAIVDVVEIPISDEIVGAVSADAIIFDYVADEMVADL